MGIKDKIKSNKVLAKIGFAYVQARVARKQFKQNKNFLVGWKSLKNSHKGERCFIIGTGPSLTISDLEKLKGETTFATNRIYELFDKTEWRPTYYVNQDHNLIKTFGEKIKTVDAKKLFLPIDYKADFKQDNVQFFVLKHKEFYPKKAPFSYDIYKYLAQGFTVTYGAIQIAKYMGFSEIFLLGIDHNYNVFRDSKGNIVRQQSTEKNYSSAVSEYVSTSALPRIEETTIAYETAEKVSRKKGFRIYNVTRGGKLEAFERKSLEEVLEGEKK